MLLILSSYHLQCKIATIGKLLAPKPIFKSYLCIIIHAYPKFNENTILSNLSNTHDISRL